MGNLQAIVWRVAPSRLGPLPGCAALGLEVVPSTANFLLVRVGDGDAVFQKLQAAGVIVRPVRSYGLPEWVRLTVGTKTQNEKLLAALPAVCGRSG